MYAARLPGEPLLETDHPAYHAICADVFDYGDGWRELWESGDTIVCVEHDMEFSDALVDELLSCPQPLCAHAYLMHQYGPPFYAHGWLPQQKGLRAQASCIRWIDHGEERADYSAVGFVKIAPRARRFPLAENIPWMAVEQEVNAATTGTWHIHWPGVEHYHK